MEFGFVTVIGLIVVFVMTYIYLTRHTDLPPGPFRIPVLGSVHFLWKSSRMGLPPHEVFDWASKTYGPVMSIWIGPKLLIVLNGYEIIHKAFVKQASDFNDRPNWISQIRNATKIGKGLSWSNGEEWKKMRKFTMKHLREFGFGTAAMEDTIREEIDAVTKAFLDTKGKSTEITDILKFAFSNIICGIIYGRRFDYDDKIFRTLIRLFDTLVKGKGFTSVTNFIPEFMYPLFPKENKLHQERKRNTATMREYFEKLIEEHESSFDESQTRDFLDYYIKVKHGKLDEDLELAREPFFNDNNVYRVINDLFMSGSQTSSKFMDWLFLYLIEYPSVQNRCRALIQQAIGERSVRLSDRVNLPYIEAVIQEVLRLSNVTPMGVPRTNVERDIFINGFRIPKKTIIIANLYSAHVDEKYWSNPHKFDPTRFLGNNGELFQPDALIPLSIGPRICPALSLVKIEMFLILATLLQRFYFKRDETEPHHDFSPRPNQFITLAPNPYRLKIIPV